MREVKGWGLTGIDMNTEPTTYFGASTMDRIKGRSSSHSHSHSHHSHSYHTNNQLDDKDGDTSTISKHNTGEGSSGSQTRDFALHVLEYAGIADSLLERELPELNRFSFEVGKERRIGLREGDEDEVEEEGARSPGDKGKGRME